MTSAKRKLCELNARNIQFFRCNPVIACEYLLGIKLFDAQKWIIQEAWNKSHVCLCCSRNFGKSFVGAIIILLKALLYPDQSIYIIAPSGAQSKELFNKIEEIVTGVGRTAASIKSLKDIAKGETVKSSNNKTGFSHAPESYEVSFYNGSSIFTLNSNPERIRSRRATMVFFDEAAFCSDELVTAAEAFATQESNFSTSTDEDFSPLTQKRRCGTQLIYASSQDDVSKTFYKKYREFAKEMFAGNRDYFCCDASCELAIRTFMNGKQYIPLLSQEKVDAAMRMNREKALREYYNIPTRDGGVNQIIKWGEVRNVETFFLPVLKLENDKQMFVFAYDPARINDNSIVSVMELFDDNSKGVCGRIVNCVNFIDTDNGARIKLDSNRQIDNFREMLVRYNGDEYADYVHIDIAEIDAGSGGGGVSTYADALLSNFTDKHGNEHCGLIDKTYDLYRGYEERYPNAKDKLRLLNPKKMRNQMVEETIELIKDGILQFPYEYNDSGYLKIPTSKDGKEEQLVVHEVTNEERMALMNIDLMKTELTSMHRFKNADGTTATYALDLEKRSRMHDDRFYTLIMLGHRLYELRRTTKVKNTEEEYSENTSAYSCVSDISF